MKSLFNWLSGILAVAFLLVILDESAHAFSRSTGYGPTPPTNIIVPGANLPTTWTPATSWALLAQPARVGDGVTVTGSITASVLTVTSIDSGSHTIAVGDNVDGFNGPDIIKGATVASLGTGTGGVGTYNLTTGTTTLASTSMTIGAAGYGTSPVAAWDDPPSNTFTGGYQVCLYATHQPTAAEAAGGSTNNVDHVDFYEDGGAATTISARTANPTDGLSEYCVNARASDTADGIHEFRAIAYPTTGMPTVMQGAIHGPVQFDGTFAGNTMTVTAKANGWPNANVLTIGTAVTTYGLPLNSFITGDLNGGDACVPTACSGSGGSGRYAINQSLTLAAYGTGNHGYIQAGAYDSQFINTNANGTLPSDVVHVANSGVDTGNCQSIGSPCITMNYAMNQCATALGSDVGGCDIKLAAGNYLYANSTHRTAASQYVTVEPEAGVPRASVILDSINPASTHGLFVDKVHLHNLTGSVIIYVDSGVAPYAALWADTLNWNTSTIAQADAYGGLFFTETATDGGSGFQFANLVRGSSYTNGSGADTFHNTKWMLADNASIMDDDMCSFGAVTAGSKVITGVTSFSPCPGTTNVLIKVGGTIGTTNGNFGSTGSTIASFDSGAATITTANNAASSNAGAHLRTASHPDFWQGLGLQANMLEVNLNAQNHVYTQIYFGDGTLNLYNVASVNSNMSNLGTTLTFLAMQVSGRAYGLYWNSVNWGGSMSWRTENGFAASDSYILNNTCTSKISANGVPGANVAGFTYRGSTTCH